MRIIRLAGLVFVAVMAMSFAAVSSASAFSSNPLFAPANGQTVTAESSTPSVLATTGFKVSCETNHVVSGHVSTALLIGNVVIHYLGCKYTESESTTHCTVKSVGGGEGLILTTTLHGILGLLLPSNETGILFLPVSGKIFTTFEAASPCAPVAKIEGSAAALISPTGSSQLTGKITTLTSLKPAIDLTHGLGTVTAKLTFAGEIATIEQTDNVTFGEKTEVT